jgi:hypothetical protein
MLNLKEAVQAVIREAKEIKELVAVSAASIAAADRYVHGSARARSRMALAVAYHFCAPKHKLGLGAMRDAYAEDAQWADLEQISVLCKLEVWEYFRAVIDRHNEIHAQPF